MGGSSREGRFYF